LTGDDRQSTSAVAAQVGARIAGAWGLHERDVGSERQQVGGTRVVVAGLRDNRHIFNIGYRLDGPLLKQSDISILAGRTTLEPDRRFSDYVERRTIDGFYGLEYSDCCWQIRCSAGISCASCQQVAGDAESGRLFLQIVFKV
jgi:hypothetical protein